MWRWRKKNYSNEAHQKSPRPPHLRIIVSNNNSNITWTTNHTIIIITKIRILILMGEEEVFMLITSNIRDTSRLISMIMQVLSKNSSSSSNSSSSNNNLMSPIGGQWACLQLLRRKTVMECQVLVLVALNVFYLPYQNWVIPSLADFYTCILLHAVWPNWLFRKGLECQWSFGSQIIPRIKLLVCPDTHG